LPLPQETGNADKTGASQSDKKVDLTTVASLLHQLQAEVRDLRGSGKRLNDTAGIGAG